MEGGENRYLLWMMRIGIDAQAQVIRADGESERDHDHAAERGAEDGPADDPFEDLV